MTLHCGSHEPLPIWTDVTQGNVVFDDAGQSPELIGTSQHITNRLSTEATTSGLSPFSQTSWDASVASTNNARDCNEHHHNLERTTAAKEVSTWAQNPPPLSRKATTADDTTSAPNHARKMPLCVLNSASGFQCRPCDELSPNFMAAMMHQFEKHIPDTKFKCVTCHRRCDLRQALRHGKTHHEQWCPICDIELKTDHDLRQHVENKHSRESRAQANFGPASDAVSAAASLSVNPEAQQPCSDEVELASFSIQSTHEAYLAVAGILDFLTLYRPDLSTSPWIISLYELSLRLQPMVFQ